ncbi:MAG TPA: bifunctional pyr operon transcriptional regulator/uracil phosphoribosyltransferase PyrR [Candidatus Cloacimonas acidaminovorans]|jgi:pyrimidine operon attenuation protein/uracil phosphoribosyltransferase|uniref:Bifunctional protein PyrR n=1 Tax=Cloacimonas acidaminovorans (strain Evry) TaxID=459349 RepID=B0VJA1_CLOAI|nr:bifunctional pyr operon transcriptional regulator/uracil phosphoribosyltransferase PyrR [Candidatus Cloacimonas acidaminovorans]MBP8704732.1 bifunctional pyr operon transcriptional regulator/uracil phosphoribosyltransferase PyrR [Candidatus Cloacimonas sp.]NLM89611.1 bifunctional pyr operon transcriptional regulator/uracil phosphoribosyltransferase PyrR [Candidatus Cloacimonadota bacterium]MDD3607073.1 bifunctional pyr operon transcriptional regulator/uracil phosphoribosyltransferase PyrR [Ca
MLVKSQIMDKDQMERSLQRMAHEIIEQNRGLEKIRLVGIRSRGVPLAERLSSYLKLISNQEVPVGILDITLYRDDLSTISHQPVIKGSAIDFDIEDAVVVLVDDVLYTGRTVRAAIDALMDFGRPKQIQLAVLIDRGHRELPIKADYVGKNVPTSKEEIIKVSLEETDGEDSVKIVLV